MLPLQLFIGTGTLVNMAMVVAGAGLGMLLGDRIGVRTRDAVTDLLGLMTIVIGALSVRPLLDPPLNQAVGSGAVLVIILLALLLGTLLGAGLRLEDRVEQFGGWLRRCFAARGETDPNAASRQRFIDGFVTATLVFCIGPLAVLGSLSDGLGRGADQLFVKSLLDGFTALAFASSFGIGVMFAALPLGVYQGALTLLAWWLGDVLPSAQVDAMSVAGGIILLGLGLRLLKVKHVRVAEMLPGLLLAPVAVWLASLIM